MKKLVLIATVALMTTTAFAQKHMVQFDNFSDSGRSGSFDITQSSNDADNETSTMNIAINYAYAVTNEIQVGFTYRDYAGEEAGADVAANTIGLNFFYNLDGALKNSKYIALRYWTSSVSEATGDNGVINGAEDDTQTDIVLEYGKRWHIGSGWGFDLTFSPNVQYAMSTFSDDSADEDTATNTLTWNWLKFDVLF